MFGRIRSCHRLKHSRQNGDKPMKVLDKARFGRLKAIDGRERAMAAPPTAFRPGNVIFISCRSGSQGGI